MRKQEKQSKKSADMDKRMTRIHKAAEYISGKNGSIKPMAGIVLGSGLGQLADMIENATVIPYREIPDFPVSTAIGHKGNFIIGELGGKKVIAMQGRFHFYEGWNMEDVVIGVRVMKELGVEFLFVSNAAGGCNPDYRVGDLVVIKDHISRMPNPLIGPNIDELGPRFPDMTCAYDAELRNLADKVSSKMGLKLEQGVYLASTGPTYETPAEVRYFRAVGADLLGMSTVPEVIAARHCGLRVFGVSVVTNECNTSSRVKTLNDGKDVILQAAIAADRMTKLFIGMIEEL